MSLIFITGFEHGFNPFEFISWYSQIDGNEPSRTGRYGCSYGYSGGGPVGYQNIDPVTEIYWQCCYMTTYDIYGAGEYPLAWCGTPTTNVMKLYWDSTFHLYMQVPGGTFRGTTGLTSIPLNTWVCIEVHVKLHPTEGVVEVRLNGSTELFFSGKTDYVDYINRFGMGSPQLYTYTDDIIVNDTSGTSNNSWPGDQHIVYLPANADGSITQWTPTPAGSPHYTKVDEVIASDSDYISSSNPSEVEFFQLANLPAAATAIVNVITFNRARKSSISSTPPTQIHHGVLVSGVTTWAEPVDLIQGFSTQEVTWSLNPVTGQRWTVDEVNALQVGIKPSS